MTVRAFGTLFCLFSVPLWLVSSYFGRQHGGDELIRRPVVVGDHVVMDQHRGGVHPAVARDARLGRTGRPVALRSLAERAVDRAARLLAPPLAEPPELGPERLARAAGRERVI